MVAMELTSKMTTTTTTTNSFQKTQRRPLSLLWCCLAFIPTSAAAATAAATATTSSSHHHDVPVEYGVDISFPIHRATVSTNYPWLPHNLHPFTTRTPKEYKGMPLQPLGDRQAFYNETIQGCVDYYKDKGYMCLLTEAERVAMSLRQPQSMQNYTDIGFKKMKAPAAVWKLLQEFWSKNNQTWSNREEAWPAGNTYTNHWKAKTYLVSVEDAQLRGGGYQLKQALWDAAKSTIEEWTGQELTQCSLYGVRVYTEGAVLSTHVDRLPLVSSAIINVAQDVDEPWPLEVIGHDGKAYNVTMEPGDMVLYESHSVLHGRPFPLKGRFLANVFVHFEPTGHTLRHFGKENAANNVKKDVRQQYREALQRGSGGHETLEEVPSYVLPGSPEDKYRHERGENKKVKSFSTGSTAAHVAAHDGNVKTLSELLQKQKDVVHALDENGWQPLHEAARGGHVDVVKLLLEHGANVNHRTNGGRGGSALFYAMEQHGEDHPVVQYLQSVGGTKIEPEL